ncbi:MAG: hydroxyacylglutathione hydrolase [Alphaproteobacteria bacterium]|nr:hydroxyacylglutathione hydrolase [Alphaproteobacteria bacterium]
MIHSAHVQIVPVLQDNYAYIIESDGVYAVVDPGEAGPVIEALQKNKLSAILLTHHHGDHIGGAAELKKRYSAAIIAPAAEEHRIQDIDVMVREGDIYTVGQTEFHVIETPGHTAGHVCFYAPAEKFLFSADTLFSLGCGRLFEGTAEQMWESLQKLAALPDDTLVYCGHEYTAANARFALGVEPDNKDLKDRAAAVTALRAANRPTVPVHLGLEKQTNPFLRAGSAARFGALRMAKDNS